MRASVTGSQVCREWCVAWLTGFLSPHTALPRCAALDVSPGTTPITLTAEYALLRRLEL